MGKALTMFVAKGTKSFDVGTAVKKIEGQTFSINQEKVERIIIK